MDKVESVILTVRKGSIMIELSFRVRLAPLDVFHALMPRLAYNVKLQDYFTWADA